VYFYNYWLRIILEPVIELMVFWEDKKMLTREAIQEVLDRHEKYLNKEDGG
jgi:hypothetical protein